MEKNKHDGSAQSARGKQWRRALERALALEDGEGDGEATLRRIAIGVVKRALEGDKDAWQEIAQRLDGKTVQMIATPEDEALQIVISETQARL